MSLVALAGCGCAPAPERPVPRAVHDLLTAAREEAPEDQASEPLASFTLTPENRDACPWTTEGESPARHTLLPPFGSAKDRFDMEPALALFGPGEHRFAFPCEHVAGEIAAARVRVWLGGTGAQRVRAVAYDAGGVAREVSPWRPCTRSGAPQGLEFDLPEPGDGGGSRAGIRLEFEAGGEYVGLASFELLRAASADRGPRLGSPELVLKGSGGRSAAGLTEGRPWLVTLPERRSPDAPRRLHLSLSVPDAFLGNAPGTRLWVAAYDGDEDVFAHSIDVARVDAGAWRDETLDLARVPAKAGTLRLWLEDDDPARRAYLLVGDPVLTEPVPDPHTVLLVTSDTHRADFLGIYSGRPRVYTPNLDALARRGVYFDSALATTNITNPSHVSVMTGIHPRDTRIVDNNTPLAERALTLAEVFRAAGYRTFGAVSTQHLGPEQSGLGQGFGRFDATHLAKRRGDVAIGAVADWLRGAEGEPAFAWLHVFDAHGPYEPPPESRERSTAGIPRTVDGGLGLLDADETAWIRRAGITNAEYVDALYAGEVAHFDAALERLLSLERMQRATLAFTADHGESLQTHGIPWGHHGAYLNTLAVPLVLVDPSLEPARVSLPVQQVDVGRTLLGLAGIDAAFPGRDLVSAARDGRAPEPLFGLSGFGLQGTVTFGDWHLVMDLESFDTPRVPHRWEKGRTRLFARSEGLDSEVDRSGEHPEVTEELRGALLGWLAQGNPTGLGGEAALSAEALDNLQQLGYAGFEDGGGDWYVPEPGER